MTRKKLAVLYPLFLGGGAEYVTAWMLQVLKDEYDVTLFTLSPIDFERLDRQFGTQLAGAGVHLQAPSGPARLFGNLKGYSWMTLRQHVLANYFRRNRRPFDLAIGAFNEMDLGAAGLQYVHVPLFGHGSQIARRVLHYPSSRLRTLYQRTCEWLLGYSDERMRRNLTLTNSSWTADLIGRSYGLEAQVLPPPVILDAPDVPWGQRETGFVCSGRLSPDKNLEMVIEILGLVRERGHNVHLHILGAGPDTPYRSQILQLARDNSSWLFLQEGLSRHELAAVLACHRFGIHGRANETFGISVAEMVRAGCLPFVPAEGGQAEVVHRLPELCFRGVEDAADKIVSVLDDGQRVAALRHALTAGPHYSLEEFRTQLGKTVAKMIQ